MGRSAQEARRTGVSFSKHVRQLLCDAALAECHMRQAILIVAKLDRLTRNTEFLMKLKSDQADIVFCDLPK